MLTFLLPWNMSQNGYYLIVKGLKNAFFKSLIILSVKIIAPYPPPAPYPIFGEFFAAFLQNFNVCELLI